MIDKTQNEEAEFSVLGAVMLEQQSMDSISFLRPEFFTTHDRSTLFAAMEKIHSSGGSIDIVTLLECDSSLSRELISYCIDYVPTTFHLGKYAQIVKDCHTFRELLNSCDEAKKKALRCEDIGQAIDSAESEVLKVRELGRTNKSNTIQQTLQSTFKELEHRYKNRGKILGIPSGFKDIDELTAGFQKGNFIILGGRPGSGKTSFVSNVVENICKHGEKVLFFSLEMSAEELMNRLISGVGRIDSGRIRSGDFASKINNWNLEIDDNPYQTILDIRASARRHKRSEKGLGLIVVDYLQLMRVHTKTNSREQDVSTISREFKLLAKELGIPIIVLAQINRGVESRENKRPRCSDLRESGSLEQDADMVMFTYRESEYCDECKKKKADCGKGHYNTGEIIIDKQRGGRVGSVDMAWLGELCRFESITKPKNEARY
jgi:replicative DNA helicase